MTYYQSKSNVFISYEKPDKAIQKKSGYKIPSHTNKRKDQESVYAKLCTELDADLRERKIFNCFFCGKKITDKQTYEHHHLQGREEDRLTDADYIIIAHTQCHFDYHNISVKKIEWFSEYLLRVQSIDSTLYFLEKAKLSK